MQVGNSVNSVFNKEEQCSGLIKCLNKYNEKEDLFVDGQMSSDIPANFNHLYNLIHTYLI